MGVWGYLAGTRVPRLQPPPVPTDTLTRDPLRVTKPLSNTKGNRKNTKKNDTTMNRKDSEYWLNGPSAIESEQNMAHFLNSIVDAVEKAMGGKILNKQ